MTKDRQISIKLQDFGKKTHSFSTIKAFREFLVSERAFWDRQYSKLGERPQNVHLLIEGTRHACKRAISSLDSLESDIDVWDDATLQQNLQQQIVSNFHPNNWLSSIHPYCETFVQCQIEGGKERANAFIEFVVNRNVQRINDSNGFWGIMAGYEFSSQDSDITKRRLGEKVALGQLRARFSDAIDKVFEEAHQRKSEIESWQAGNASRQARRYFAHGRVIRRQLSRQTDKFDSSMTGWQKKISELENTYREKLRLEAPADYWKKRAKALSLQGGLWATLLIVTSLIIAVGSGCFFWAWLHKEPVPFGLQSLQGIALFGAAAAAATFLVRVLSRLTFSAFHLQRDAEEREQLAHLYLSLMEGGHTDENSRAIILQALFSRAESGLLAGDHGPTMPSPGDVAAVLSRTRTP